MRGWWAGSLGLSVGLWANAVPADPQWQPAAKSAAETRSANGWLGRPVPLQPADTPTTVSLGRPVAIDETHNRVDPQLQPATFTAAVAPWKPIVRAQA